MPVADALALPFAAAVFWAVMASFALAGLVKGVVGMGLPTVAMGLLSAFMAPAQAALLLLPSLVTNVWQMVSGPALRAVARCLWSLQIGVVAGTVAAPVGLAGLDAGLASAGLGLALMFCAGLGLVGVRLAVPLRWQVPASPLVGLATGAVTAATGVFVFPAVPYLQGLGLDKDELVQALGLSFTVSAPALSWRLVADGAALAATPAMAGTACAALAAALLGMALGQRLRGRCSEPAFRRVFFAGLLLLGLHLAAKGLMH